MCGVVGVLNHDGAPVDITVLTRMTRAVAHRGPDGQGVFLDGAAALGHRRLAILDLTPAGRQPMATAKGDLVISYSGEVYNCSALREELEELGHTFRSRTDTEVVLLAYQEWGVESIGRLNGMFAFAIWDARSREMILVRDRYGIKPLYYTRVGGTFLFASEIKAFLGHPGFRADLSLPHLFEYMTFQNIFSAGTLFEGVDLLPPGHWLRVTADGNLRLTRYWDFRFEDTGIQASDQEVAAELKRLFEQAVKRQLMSDVPVGAFLSGGMDSGAVTAVAAREMPYLSTFTAGFDMTSVSGLELGFDERREAEAMSYLCRTEHYEIVLKAGDMERCLDDLVWHLEDPRVGQSYPNWYAARLASRFVKVALAGTGGDELFGGYPWRYFIGTADGQADYIDQYFRAWNRLVPPDSFRSLFRDELWAEVEDRGPYEAFRGVFPQSLVSPKTPEAYLSDAFYFECRTFLHGLLLVEDKLGMAHGLETRVPFLDNDLVDFAQRVPVRMKIRDLTKLARVDENNLQKKVRLRHRESHDGKLVFREAMRRVLPIEVATRPKRGFSGPDATWFRGQSIDHVNALVFNDHAHIFEYLNPRTVRQLVADHTSGRANRRLFIWSLLMLETWLRVFKDGEASPGGPSTPAASAYAI
jgi:asparagine synthase (glutamine-hydrolysing)